MKPKNYEKMITYYNGEVKKFYFETKDWSLIPNMHVNMYPFDYSSTICFRNNLYLMGGFGYVDTSDYIYVFYTETQEFEKIIKLD